MYLPKTYDNDIIERNQLWAESINKYQNDKKTLEWGYNSPPKIIKESVIKQRDCIFNPVTQAYTDKKLDHHLKIQDKIMQKEIITKNHDNKLMQEQTYNIINRDDKLKVRKFFVEFV